MELDHEGIYYMILSDGKYLSDEKNGSDEDFLSDEDEDPLKGTRFENVTKEQILEILQTHFGVDFGYDIEAWQKYIANNGGWFFNFWEGEMYKTQHQVFRKYIKVKNGRTGMSAQ